MTNNNLIQQIEAALVRYHNRVGAQLENVQAVLFDMDGVLYDSMPGHARAWKAMCDAVGIQCEYDEFFGYEGRTGASTINCYINVNSDMVPTTKLVDAFML